MRYNRVHEQDRSLFHAARPGAKGTASTSGYCGRAKSDELHRARAREARRRRKEEQEVMKNGGITHSDLVQILDYDLETGEFTWKKQIGRGKPGVRAGADAHNGYRHICIKRRPYLAHRLAWFYVHGEWPHGEIDHINCQKSDNRISNLRLAARWQNMCNKKQVRAACGVRGVYWHRKSGKWSAQIRVNSRRIHLGLFDDLNAAGDAYRAAAAQHFGEFDPGRGSKDSPGS